MPYSHEVYVRQRGLKALGFNPGIADGIDGRATQRAFKASLAKSHGLSEAKATNKDAAGYPPAPIARNKISVFGPHGIKGGFTPKMSKVAVPWNMRYLKGGPKVRTISCHHLIATPLKGFMDEIYKTSGNAGILKYGFDLWAGCYAPRKSRGGSSMSDHAWAIAIDWNNEANGNYQKWAPDRKMPNGTYQFSNKIVAIARKHGFQVGFKSGSGRRDMMHFAYVSRN